ncbi:DMT family transporter [Pseudaestuariivita sp.]|uniref:DMT family transporter n=1 Tax=Pseudaestuariivita sp. TaxID=2211669 RepID=UPI0040591808
MWRLALLLCFGMSLIPAGDTAGKLLQAEGVAAPFVAWARFVVGALAVLPFLPRAEFACLRDPRLWFRGALIGAGIFSILTALSRAPLADAFAGLFVGPIVSVVLSALLLKERVSALRWLLVLAGFAGVLMVVRPTGNAEPFLAFAVLAGLFYGGFLTASRWLAGAFTPKTLLASQMLAAMVLLTPLGLWFWPEMSPKIIALLLVSGLCSMGGNLTLILAYRQASAAQVAPFVYVQLLAATALGYLVFQDVPAPLTWAGMAVIALAGIISTQLPPPSAHPGARGADRR